MCNTKTVAVGSMSLIAKVANQPKHSEPHSRYKVAFAKACRLCLQIQGKEWVLFLEEHAYGRQEKLLSYVLCVKCDWTRFCKVHCTHRESNTC